MQKRYIGLMVTPGDGFREVEVTDDMTVADFVQREDLHGRSLTLDGNAIEPGDFASTTLNGIDEVWATGGAKGA